MNKINQTLRLLFAFSLLLSIGFPLGVLGIIFGATGGNTFLLVGGILLTAAGFYVMPILWVRYAERRGDRTLCFMIEKEHIYTVEGLVAQTGYTEENVRTRIMRMIHGHILVGYLFRDDVLEQNENEEQSTKRRRTKKCPQCGALMVFDGLHFYCEYCRYTEREK